MEIIDLSKSVAKNEVISKAKQVDIPAGYIPIRLSTKGKIGAPEIFHVRNFNTNDVMTLAVADEGSLPFRVLSILQRLIFEPEVDVRMFHEQEIIETLLTIYANFISTKISVEYTPTEEELIYLKEHKPILYQAYVNSSWKPKLDIDIPTVDTYNLPEDFNGTAIITSKKTGFTVGFGLPRYGDVLTLKEWIKAEFEQTDKEYAEFEKLKKLQVEMLYRYRNGEISQDKIPIVSKDDEEKYSNYNLKKMEAMVDVIRAMHLIQFEDRDVSKLSIAERILLIQDPRIDIKLARKLDTYFMSLKFGLKPEVKVKNPITEEVCLKTHTFRIPAILQTLQLQESDSNDSLFGDEYEFNTK